MGRYDIVLWDADATLLDFKKSQEYALKAGFAYFHYHMTPQILERYDKINDSFWKRLERGEVDRKTLQTGRFLQLFEEFSIDHIDAKQMQKIYERELGNVFFYIDNSYDLCMSLKENYRQFIVTNGNAAVQKNKLHLAGFDSIMEDIFISEEIGEAKPHKLFFDRCFQKIGVKDRDRVLIVGDSLTSDIRGGNNCGIATCWYNPTGMINDTDVIVTYEIKHLQEIKTILKE